MTVRFRMPEGHAVCVQILFLLFALALTWDAYEAFRYPDLYPWGTENPDGASWNYENQTNYLKSSISLIAIVLIVIFVPFFVAHSWLSIAVMFIFVYALGHFSQILLPHL